MIKLLDTPTLIQEAVLRSHFQMVLTKHFFTTVKVGILKRNERR